MTTMNSEASGEAPPERVNTGTPPDVIWVHPWRVILYYAPENTPDYIAYILKSAHDAEVAERLAQLEYTRNEREQGTVRIQELLAEVARLREALRLAANAAHDNAGFHAPNFVPFAECKKPSCAAARTLLNGKGEGK